MQDLWRIREELTLCLAQLSRSTSPLYPALSTTSAVASTAGAVKKNIEEEVETVQGGAVQGRLFKYDLSVRLQDTAELLRRLKQRVLQAGFRLKGVTAPSSARDSSEGSGSGSGGRNDLARLFSACELEFCNYGHIADQNIHLNILAAVSTTGGGNLTPSDSSSGGMLHRQSVDVPVPSDGVYAKYRKPVAAGAALDYIHAVFLSRGPGVAAVQVEVASVVAFTAMVRNELNRHIFDLVLEMKGTSRRAGCGISFSCCCCCCCRYC